MLSACDLIIFSLSLLFLCAGSMPSLSSVRLPTPTLNAYTTRLKTSPPTKGSHSTSTLHERDWVCVVVNFLRKNECLTYYGIGFFCGVWAAVLPVVGVGRSESQYSRSSIAASRHSTASRRGAPFISRCNFCHCAIFLSFSFYAE